MKRPNKKYNLKVEIIANQKVTKDYFKLTFNAPLIAKLAKPGQFVNVRINEGVEPLLRRPFSIHRVMHNSISLLYKVVGRGTEILSEKKPGEHLDIIGPLGKGFEYSSPVRQFASSPVLIAGGMGVAPLVFLAEKLTDYRPIVLIGAKTKSEILCAKEFKDLGCEVKIATDDGSQGFKGKVTELLKDLLGTIYACGPKPMLKEIARISQEFKVPAQVSLEEHMACAIGACLGCVVKTKNGSKRVCADGPVFKQEQINWREL